MTVTRGCIYLYRTFLKRYLVDQVDWSDLFLTVHGRL